MNIRVAKNFSCCIHKLRIEFIKLCVEVFKQLCSAEKCVVTVLHRSCACMVCLTENFNTVVYHTEYTGNYTDVIACRLKDRTLLNMKFKHCLVILRIKSVCLIALVTRCVKSHFKSLCRVKD